MANSGGSRLHGDVSVRGHTAYIRLEDKRDRSWALCGGECGQRCTLHHPVVLTGESPYFQRAQMSKSNRGFSRNARERRATATEVPGAAGS